MALTAVLFSNIENYAKKPKKLEWITHMHNLRYIIQVVDLCICCACPKYINFAKWPTSIFFYV